MSFWTSKIKIENIEIPRFMAAPMDGFIDSPMRQMIRMFSKEELLFTEMRHPETIINEKEGLSLKFKDIERPLCFQFSTNRTTFIKEALDKVLAKKIDMLNLNVGCPARNVTLAGAGSALMAKPKILETIIKKIIEDIGGKVPFTIKMRAGFKEKNAPEIAKLAEDLGIDAIIIHPRTKVQGYTGEPDTEIVKKIKEQSKIPIIVSGNIDSFEKAKQVFEKTGVDGFMIGRALIGAPWKLKEITDNIAGKEFTISQKEKIEVAIKHLKLVVKFYGEGRFYNIKQQIPNYIKNITGAAQIRRDLLESRTAQELEDKLKELVLSLS